MKKINEELEKNLETIEELEKKVEELEELDDEMLDGVAGGLIQLVNPSSSRL